MIDSAARRRPLLRAYLLLSRVSNLPTVLSNVLAGTVAGWPAGIEGDLGRSFVLTVLASSAFYTGGMFLNDAFDAPHDRVARPERPIPRGDVGLGHVFAVGSTLLAAGLVLLLAHVQAALLGVVLAAAIVFYDFRHKGNAFAPAVMGTCRGLVYLIAASVSGIVTAPAMIGAAVMTVYVAGLTVVAKRAGANARWLIPLLIAGISIVDALFIVAVAPSGWRFAVVALLAFPLTLVAQRWVPGD